MFIDFSSASCSSIILVSAWSNSLSTKIFVSIVLVVDYFICSHNKKYLIFAMQDGSIRVNKVNPRDHTDLSDYWQLPMHDNSNGFISKMCFSFNEKYFFTAGHDGNIFAYQFFPENDEYKKDIPRKARTCKERDYKDYVQDVFDPKTLSLEEAIVKKEFDRINDVANFNKKVYREKIDVLRERFFNVLERNDKLLPTQVIAREQFMLDKHIIKDLEEIMEAELAFVKRTTEFKVEKSKVLMDKLMRHFVDPLDVFPMKVTGIEKAIEVATMRQRRLDPDFTQMQEYVEEKIIEAEIRGRYFNFFTILHLDELDSFEFCTFCNTLILLY